MHTPQLQAIASIICDIDYKSAAFPPIKDVSLFHECFSPIGFRVYLLMLFALYYQSLS